MLEVILKKDIYRLGDRGQVVKVADGYARNFLYPQKLAIPATKGSLKQLQEMESAAQREAVRLRGDAEKQVAAIEGVVVRVVARAGQKNQLFGSITNRQIAAELAKQGIEIDRHRIEMQAPLRLVGDYDVVVRFYKNVETTVKVEVRAEGREDEPLISEEETADDAQAESAEAPEAADSDAAADSDEVAADSAEAAGDEAAEEG